MKCSRCGAKVEEGKLFCLSCGQEVQIVPDYNPVEEIVIQNVIDAQIDHIDNNEQDEELNSQTENVGSLNDTKKIEVTPNDLQSEKTDSKESVDALKKLQKKITIISAIVVVFIIATIAINAVIIVRHNNSFEYQKACGYVELENENYEKAYEYFNKALSIDNTSIEIRFQIAKVEQKLGDILAAESMYNEIISIDENNVEAGKELLKLYSENSMTERIETFFESIKEKTIYEELLKYHVETPVFSVEPGKYQRFVAVEIFCNTEKCQIYYTVDGTSPTSENSIPYSGLIRLPNGTTTIKAIATNQEGYISEEIEGTYTVDYEAPDNPVFSPNGGDYYYATPITIEVPNGCNVFYTIDGSVPTEQSRKYNGYIDMPIGNNLIKAVAIDKSGFVSNTIEATFNLNFDASFSIEQAHTVIMAHLANNPEDERGVFDLSCNSAYSVGEFNLYIFEKVYGTDINGKQIINENQKFAFDVLTGETYIAYPNNIGGYDLEAF